MELYRLRHPDLACALMEQARRPAGVPWIAALTVLTLVRLAVAAWMPLSPDEAYYWIWSRASDLSYLDHPPMVAWWIRIGTTLLPDGAAWLPLGVRLLGPVSAALGSILLVRAGIDLFASRTAGLKAALLLNATLFLGAGSVIMTPDTPLLFFCVLLLFALGRIVDSSREDRGQGGWWLLAGLAAGCGLLSKYTAALPIMGMGLWLLDQKASFRWIRRWHPWAGLMVAAVLFSPVILWNVQHGWASFIKQGGRNGAFHWTFRYLGELLGGQAGLATPGVFLLCAAGVGQAFHIWLRQRRQGEPAELATAALLAALTLPGIIFLEHALGDRVQANWPALLYPAACLAAGGLLPGWRWFRVASVLGLGITALVYMQATLMLLPLPPKLDPAASRMSGWQTMAQKAAELARANGMKAVVADNYDLASELAVYLPVDVQAWGMEPRWRLFRLPYVKADGASVLLIETAKRKEPPDPLDWADLQSLGEVVRQHDGRVIETYHLYRARPLGTATLLPRQP
ncbi:Undecaprenyl-phosphomannose:protein mannosyltransferase [Granulibacter bethesdensis]|uniref:ArnT family glycosyltransferase n=1 Tax=Granulibacter bethesdensis TaxID=364410 RepID=UPI00090C7DC3|nr:glycosyltransferase family 39 protein [Granulibacter bethesdensis]APH57294.1 Undecaprenyl-phosphomannose:protein mannosyltransferase [Granulibacter bethesdensis]